MAERVEIIITAVDKASGVLSGIGKAAGTLAKVGFAAAAAGATGLAVALGSSVREAMKAQDVQAQLNAVIKSTKGIAGVTADSVNELADKFSKVTRYEDEAIISGENMLLTFTNIGKDVFPGATEAMLNMSTALGQDLSASAMQLGKALQDPVEGVAALRRVGVKLTDAQEDMIKKMVEAGDIAGAQKIILQELQTEFGGSAVAAGETFAGQLDILKNSLGNVQEKIGEAVIPVLQMLLENFILPAADGVAVLAEKFAVFMDTVKTKAEGLIAYFQGGGTMGMGVISYLFGADFATKAQEIIDFLGPVIDAFRNLVSAIQEQAPMVQTALQGLWDWIQGVFATIGPQLIDSLSSIINSMAEIWRTHGEDIMAVVSTLFQVIFVTISGALTLILGIVQAALLVLQGDWQGAGAAITSAWQAFLTMVLSITGTTLAQFNATWKANFEMLKAIINAGMQAAINIVVSTIQQWYNAGVQLVNGLRDGIASAIEAMKAWLASQLAEIAEMARGVLGIGSPSKVFAEIGQQMMEGLKVGVEQNVSAPMAATAQAAQSVTNTAYYNLTINEAGSRGDIVHDFGLLQALAGV